MGLNLPGWFLLASLKMVRIAKVMVGKHRFKPTWHKLHVMLKSAGEGRVRLERSGKVTLRKEEGPERRAWAQAVDSRNITRKGNKQWKEDGKEMGWPPWRPQLSQASAFLATFLMGLRSPEAVTNLKIYSSHLPSCATESSTTPSELVSPVWSE